MVAANAIIPCIWLDDQAEQAADFYISAFRAGRVLATSRYPETVATPSPRPPGSVLTVEFEVAGRRFTTLNAGPIFTPNPSISFFAFVDAAAEVDRLYAALAKGGSVMMALDTYPWSARYAWVADRYGVSWQLMFQPDATAGTTIVPCLMFSDAQARRAAEAIDRFCTIFPDSRHDFIDPYPDGDPAAGAVRHARFTLAGQAFAAMDSPVDHGFTFSEGLSLQIMCADQVEVDRYWDALGDGGEHGPCGWLKDRFGVSWQVVPTAIAEWMVSADVVARDRAFAAMLQMSKLDIAALQRAFAGG